MMSFFPETEINLTDIPFNKTLERKVTLVFIETVKREENLVVCFWVTLL